MTREADHGIPEYRKDLAVMCRAATELMELPIDERRAALHWLVNYVENATKREEVRRDAD